MAGIESLYSEQVKPFFTQILASSEDYGETHPCPDEAGAKRQVGIVYATLKWGHLTYFLLFCLFRAAKKRRYFNLAQFISVLMPIIYLGACFYLVYFLKRCEDLVADTNKKLTYGDLWLIIETMIFLY